MHDWPVGRLAGRHGRHRSIFSVLSVVTSCQSVLASSPTAQPVTSLRLCPKVTSLQMFLHWVGDLTAGQICTHSSSHDAKGTLKSLAGSDVCPVSCIDPYFHANRWLCWRRIGRADEWFLFSSLRILNTPVQTISAVRKNLWVIWVRVWLLCIIRAWLSLVTNCTGNRARERKQKRRRRLGRFSTCPLASVRSNSFKVHWGITRRCRAIKSWSHRGMRLDLVRGDSLLLARGGRVGQPASKRHRDGFNL